MNQPKSHKDIDFGQTLYALEFKMAKTEGPVTHKVTKAKVEQITQTGWNDTEGNFFSYIDTFYTKEDLIVCLAAYFGISVKLPK